MIRLERKTKFEDSGDRKAKVFFTCHDEDFEALFDQICKKIFNTHDCAVYYTDGFEDFKDEDELNSTLGQMAMVVIPVTKKLIFEESRAMRIDIPYAKEHRIPILPIVMETSVDRDFLSEYSSPDKFGEMQYISPYLNLKNAIAFEDKLRSFLDTVLVGEELKTRIRKAFDAYIFLSYRKKDRKYASELMKLIHGFPEFRDIAIWYDEYLTPGENFRDNIERALESSDLMALLVTPNILEEKDNKPNFVMAEEYPRAMALGKRIIPAEMETTDHLELIQKFIGIPTCVDPSDKEALKESLIDALYGIAISENNNDPEHNFLIGLAYLDGIDVEVDRERGEELIYQSASQGLPEAIIKYYHLLGEKGTRLFRNQEKEKMLELARLLHKKYADEYGETDVRTLDAYKMVAEVSGLHACRELCKISADTYGKEHPKTIEYYSVLIKYCNNKEKTEIGEEMYPICVKVLGEDNKIALTYLSYMAEAYFEMSAWGFEEVAPDMLDKWFSTLRRIFEVNNRFLGRLHPHTINALNEFAQGCSPQNKDKGRAIAGCCIRKAEADGREALDGAREALDKHYNYPLCHSEIAKTVYALFAREKGREDDETLSVLSDHLCVSYSELGETKKELLIREYLYPLMKEKGEAYKKSAELQRASIIRIKSELGNYEEAFSLINEAVGGVEYGKISDYLSFVYGNDALEKAKTLRFIGEALINCDNTAVGLLCFDNMLEVIKECSGIDNDLTLAALSNVFDAYTEVGKTDRATKILEGEISEINEMPLDRFGYSLYGPMYEPGYTRTKKIYELAVSTLGENNAASQRSSEILLYFLKNLIDQTFKCGNDFFKIADYMNHMCDLVENRIPAVHRDAIKAMCSSGKKVLDAYQHNMAIRIFDSSAYGGMAITDSENELLAKNIYEKVFELINRMVDSSNFSYETVDGVMYSTWTNRYGRENRDLVYYSKEKEDESFTVPEGICSLNDYSFIGAEKLVKVKLPDGLYRVGYHAFAFCNLLKEVHMSPGIEYICESIFHGCQNIERVLFNGTLQEWGEISKITPYGSARYIKVSCLDGETYLATK